MSKNNLSPDDQVKYDKYMSQLRKDENENVSDEEYVRFFEEVLDDINNPDDAEAIHEDMKIGEGAYSSFSTTTDKISYNYVYTNLTRLSDAAAEYEKSTALLALRATAGTDMNFQSSCRPLLTVQKEASPKKTLSKLLPVIRVRTF